MQAILMQYGNYAAVPAPTYYIEADSDTSTIPADAPAGSVAIVNEASNFHVLMKNSAGTWNTL